MRKKDWRDFRLYVITAPDAHPGKDLIAVMEQTLIGGADVVQLRNKTGTRGEVLEQAKALRELTRRYGVPFIVNDYPDIALQVDADGVHLGQEDMAVQEARALLGPDRIIGISTHHLEQALEAQRNGADYIGVGPVFPTNTKPGRAAVTTSYVKEAAEFISIPFVAIGGITPHNADAVLEAGARRLCAVSAIVGSDDPAAVCRALISAMERYSTDAQSAAYRTVILNGRELRTAAATLEALIHETGQGGKRLVAEMDGQVVQRADWSNTAVPDGARIELVSFVGGG